jgi:hypothetical protein
MQTMAMRVSRVVRLLPVAGALILVSAGVYGLDAPASAAPAVFVGNIGTATRNSGGNSSTTITVGLPGVAAGDSIIVAFASSTVGGTVSCADTKGNTYHVDADRIGGAGRASICSAHNVTALVSGDQITVSYPGFSGASSATANEFSGLAHSGTLDKTSAAVGNSGSPDSGLTATTTQADELLYGAIVFSGSNGATFTPGAGYTRTNPDLSPRHLASEFSNVSATGMYRANGTLTAPNQWAAVIATYHTATTNCGCFEDVDKTDATHVEINNGQRLDEATAFFLSRTCDLTGCPNGTTCFMVPASGVSASTATLDTSGVAAGTYHVVGVWNTGSFCNNDLITLP